MTSSQVQPRRVVGRALLLLASLAIIISRFQTMSSSSSSSKLYHRVVGPLLAVNIPTFLAENTTQPHLCYRSSSSSAVSVVLRQLWSSQSALYFSVAETLISLQKQANNMSFATVHSSFWSTSIQQQLKLQQQQQLDAYSFSMISMATGSNEEAVVLETSSIPHSGYWEPIQNDDVGLESVSEERKRSQPTTKDLGVATTTTENNSLWNKPIPDPITVEGVVLPARKEVTLTSTSDNNTQATVTLYRNGHGVRTVKAPFGYNLHVYVATLYTDRPIATEQEVNAILFGNGNDAPKIFVMEFTFLRDVTPKQMAIAWNYQLDSSVIHNQYDHYPQDRTAFISMLDGSMKSGGTMVFEFFRGLQPSSLSIDTTTTNTTTNHSGGSTTMKVTNQGQFAGEIKGEDFQRAFASMWFGDRPVMKEIKQGLLRGNEQNDKEVEEDHATLTMPVKVQ